MTTSTSRKLTGFQYAATLFGALAVAVLAAATAHATDNEPTGPGGGCTYTDADGYGVPIDNGQDVFVDGKIVSCRDGKIIITTAPKRGVGNVRPDLVPNRSVFADATLHSPLVTPDVPAAQAP